MSEENKDVQNELAEIEKQLEQLRKKRLELNAQLAQKDLNKDYEFQTGEGSKKLSAMFGDQKYLFTIHNMGKRCSYCSMWADGFNDTFKHIQKKGAFVLVSPDAPDVQKDIAKERGWKFDMVQDANKEFTTDMGYYTEKNGWWPGVSVFEKGDDGKIKRVGKDFFGPTDYYCNVWHFYDLIPDENVTGNS